MFKMILFAGLFLGPFVALQTQCGGHSFYDRESTSTIIGPDLSWAVEVKPIGPSLSKVFFVDMRTVFGYRDVDGTGTSVFESSDSGINWVETAKVDDLITGDLWFTSPQQGFLVGEQGGRDGVIYKTSDRGRTWKPVNRCANCVFREIGFTSGDLGVVVGWFRPLNSGAARINAALVTTDGGETWHDVSESLNTAVAGAGARRGQGLTAIHFSKETEILVSSVRGEIFQSQDKGGSWRLISSQFDDREQTSAFLLREIITGGFWLAGTAVSDEGIWTFITSTSAKNIGKRRLPQFALSDVEIQKNGEMIACGTYFPSADVDVRKGVVLTSSDYGLNWRTVFLSDRIAAFTSLSKLPESGYYVLGNNGQVAILRDQSRRE